MCPTIMDKGFKGGHTEKWLLDNLAQVIAHHHNFGERTVSTSGLSRARPEGVAQISLLLLCLSWSAHGL